MYLINVILCLFSLQCQVVLQQTGDESAPIRIPTCVGRDADLDSIVCGPNNLRSRGQVVKDWKKTADNDPDACFLNAVAREAFQKQDASVNNFVRNCRSNGRRS